MQPQKFGFFSQFASDVINNIQIKISPIQEVDAFTFVSSSSYLNEDPTPFQRIVLKTLYNLWRYYPPDKEESDLIRILRMNWNIKLDLNRTDPVWQLVLCLGRRSTKSTISSFLASYGMYSLICKGNPQEYYGIRERHPIYITHVASAGNQAKDVFTLTSENIKKTEFFRPYIDFDKDNSTELRLRSPFDLWKNDEIIRRNALLRRGEPKENLLPGSLNIKSITTSATSHRGEATFMLILSEFAHFMRAEMNIKSADETIMSENPRTDYAVYKALAPSVKDFGSDGKVIIESSPAEKGGEFYFHYCVAGGMQQEHYEEVTPDPDYALIQLATWEARPSMPRETFDRDFRTDPIGADSEYGAKFRNPSGSFITEELINSIPVPNKPIIKVNPNTWKFIITLDAGGKAKAKPADTYALGWGHSEITSVSPEPVYWVDGLKGWDQKIKDLGSGMIEKIPVNPNEVMAYLLDLISNLGGRNYVVEVCYDQWENSSAISTLQSEGYNAIETTFTNPYKGAMYGNFLTQAELGKIHMYGEDEGGWIDRWKLEMKYLQRITAGNVTYYKHPDSGPVRHDDFADVVANLTYRLLLRAEPTKQSMQEARKNGSSPIQKRKLVVPVKGPSLHYGGSMQNIRGRLR